MQPDLRRLERQLNWLRAYALASGLALATFAALSMAGPSREIIRTRGIVIEDALGHDRILIGSPIPASRSRVRTDLAKARQAWAARLGDDEYMKYYAAYDHAASGIVFLTDKGFDKLILGDKTPDANIGKRQVSLAGLTFNDDEGFERGGVGVSKTATGQYRAVLGLDDPNGREAAHLFVLEDGTKGLSIRHGQGQLFLGSAKAGNGIVTTDKNVAGLLTLDAQGHLLPAQSLTQQP